MCIDCTRACEQISFPGSHSSLGMSLLQYCCKPTCCQLAQSWVGHKTQPTPGQLILKVIHPIYVTNPVANKWSLTKQDIHAKRGDTHKQTIAVSCWLWGHFVYSWSQTSVQCMFAVSFPGCELGNETQHSRGEDCTIPPDTGGRAAGAKPEQQLWGPITGSASEEEKVPENVLQADHFCGTRSD